MASLALFICQYICDNGQDLLPAEKLVVLAGGYEDGEVAKFLNEVGVSSLEGLYSTQEEADTRLVLHAIMLSRDHPRIIIRCDDTHVLVLLVYYWSWGALADEVYICRPGTQGNFLKATIHTCSPYQYQTRQSSMQVLTSRACCVKM